MDRPSLTRDSHAVLLLASHLGSTADEDETDSGLGPAGWQDFAARIDQSSLDSPGDLLRHDHADWPDDIWTTQATREWVKGRLSRSTKLAMRLEDLNNRGIWVTTLFESTYPDHLYDTLDRKTPPFFYVAGEADNLQTRAIGFVGSRDADGDDKAHTRHLVEQAINDEFGIVSGGARGIDETSEETGLEQGGPVVEFPADGLQQCLKETHVRESVMDGRLTLASYYHPEASWSMGGAMGRNKFIHGFADYTVVVRSGDQTGGTWEGATENLTHQWSSLLVCSHDETPAGNRALIEKGGIPIDPTTLSEGDSFRQWLDQRMTQMESQTTAEAVDDGPEEDSETSLNQQSSLDEFE